jgi:hypothetical protein
MHLKPLTVFLALCLPLALTAQDFDTTNLTVRQVWDNVSTLYGTGHSFTAEEFGRLKAFGLELADAEETDLAARLDLLMLAAARENTQADVKSRLDTGSKAWDAVQLAEQKRRDTAVQEIARNIGLGGFTLSTMSALTFAALIPRTDSSQEPQLLEFLQWGFLSSGIGLILSTVPMITGETSR